MIHCDSELEELNVKRLLKQLVLFVFRQFVTMADEKICKKCSQSINVITEPYSVCEGECACSFHIGCVGLSEDDLCTMAVKTNMVWMCDTCLNKFRRMSYGMCRRTCDLPNEKPIDEQVRDLKITVTGILETLSKIVPTDVASDRALLHSTPLSTNLPCDAMNTSDMDVNNVESIRHREYTDGEDFSLFISNIESSVSERDIHRMVSLALNTPEPEHIDVSKLVSKWNQRQPPDFISFKVTLDKKWKAHAMNPLIWPKYVKFREFIERQNVTWRPGL